MARPNHIPHISKRLLKRGSFIIKQPIKFNQGLPLCAIKALLSTQTIKDDDKKFLLLQNLNRKHLQKTLNLRSIFPRAKADRKPKGYLLETLRKIEKIKAPKKTPA